MNPIEAFYKLQLRRLRKWGALLSIVPPTARKWGSDLPVQTAWSLQKGALNYTYRGLPMLKNPLDVALYQMLFFQTRPKTVIEIGSYLGTSALWFSDMMRTNETPGRVISVDTSPPSPPFNRPEISFIKGDVYNLGTALSDELLSAIERPLLVIEDSVHQPDSTLAALRFFDRFMLPDEYIVIEDGLVTDLGIAHHHAGGPGPGIAQFLAECEGRYEVDRNFCDRFGHNFTGNPNGYLRRTLRA
jgi:cephalosporin hydroxylase